MSILSSLNPESLLAKIGVYAILGLIAFGAGYYVCHKIDDVDTLKSELQAAQQLATEDQKEIAIDNATIQTYQVANSKLVSDKASLLLQIKNLGNGKLTTVIVTKPATPTAPEQTTCDLSPDFISVYNKSITP